MMRLNPLKSKRFCTTALYADLFLSVTSYLPWHWPTGMLHLGCFQWDSLHWVARLLGSHCVFHCYTNLQADTEKGLNIRRKNKNFGMLWLHIYSHNRETDYFSRLASGHHEHLVYRAIPVSLTTSCRYDRAALSLWVSWSFLNKAHRVGWGSFARGERTFSCDSATNQKILFVYYRLL